MFGFNKKKPLIEGPIEFEMEVEIDRSAGDVFRLIDISDPECAQVQRGHAVTPVDGTDDRYVLVIKDMEDLAVKFHVIENIQGQRQSVECVIEPSVGNLVKAVETYSIEPRGEDGCLVKFLVAATFADRLSDEEMAGEVAMMSMSVENDLQKLVLHAEHGVDAVLAFEEDQF